MALLILILKMTVLLEKLIPERLEVGDNNVNKFSVGSGKELLGSQKNGLNLKNWLSQEKNC